MREMWLTTASDHNEDSEYRNGASAAYESAMNSYFTRSPLETVLEKILHRSVIGILRPVL